MTSIDIRKGMGSEFSQEIEDDLVPFGFIPDLYPEEDTIVDDKDHWKSVKR